MPRARRTASITLHVSPQGAACWSGLPAAPTADRRDGPVRTPARPGVPAARYVPDVGRIGEELGLYPRIPVEDGVRRMLAWGRGRLG